MKQWHDQMRRVTVIEISDAWFAAAPRHVLEVMRYLGRLIETPEKRHAEVTPPALPPAPREPLHTEGEYR